MVSLLRKDNKLVIKRMTIMVTQRVTLKRSKSKILMDAFLVPLLKPLLYLMGNVKVLLVYMLIAYCLSFPYHGNRYYGNRFLFAPTYKNYV